MLHVKTKNMTFGSLISLQKKNLRSFDYFFCNRVRKTIDWQTFPLRATCRASTFAPRNRFWLRYHTRLAVRPFPCHRTASRAGNRRFCAVLTRRSGAMIDAVLPLTLICPWDRRYRTDRITTLYWHRHRELASANRNSVVNES